MTNDEMTPPEAATPPPPRGHRQRPGKAGSAAVAWVDRLAEATTLFERASHNPSWRSVREAIGPEHDLVDFCVPVNPYFPPPALLQEIAEHLPQISKVYPDDAVVHQRAIGALVGLPAENVVAANGSTELITSLCRDLQGPLLTPVPTFGRWTDLPQQFGRGLLPHVRRQADDYTIDVAELVNATQRTGARALVLCNPDNPTGTCIDDDAVRWLLRQLASLDLVVIDESFIDFAGQQGASRDVLSARNAIVVKSLGKSIGWHGVRLGYAVAHEALAAHMRQRLPLWNVNGLAAFVLQRLGDHAAAFAASLTRVAQDREAMAERLRALPGLRVYPSRANFLYCQLERPASGRQLRDALLVRHGLLIRECSNKLGACEQFLRLAVLPPASVDRLVQALRTELGEG
jgi:threonine-phosphate decarboxylase